MIKGEETMGKIKELKRVWVDLVIVGVILLVYGTGLYTLLPSALQLVSLKALLVSMGILVAHIAGKMMFPKMMWDCPPTAGHYVRIALYMVCVLAFALGG